mgnify:FL=1
MARTLALDVSNRLLPVMLAVICIMASQLMVASCTPEPVPYASRVAISR